MANETKRSPQKAPNYALHRAVSAADAAAITDQKLGMNMEGHEYAHIQVVPVGGANPTVEVQWWSAEAGAFIQEHTALTKAGVGADTPFEFTVQCLGRIMYVKVPTMASGTCKILVSGAEVEHR